MSFRLHQESGFWGCDPRFVALFSLLALLLVLDIVTTNEILTLGGVEYNPVMSIVVGSPFVHVVVKGIFLACMFCWAKWWNGRFPHAGVYILSVLCGWFLIVVGHNLSALAPVVFS
jgi:NADH:ubiquinone oxidoreductase subunit H